MLKLLTARSTRAAMAALLAGGALLVACDRIEDRLGRAREVADASVGQISGETVVDPTQRNLTQAAVLDRAIGGTVLAQFEVDEEERPLFAIGSIIAKPIDVPPTFALMVEEEAYFDLGEDAGAPVAAEPVTDDTPAAASPPAEEVMESLAPALRRAEIATPENLRRIRIDPRDMGETRQEVARAARDLEQIAIEAPSDVAQRRIQRSEIRALEPEAQDEVLKLARRAPVTRQAVRRQLDANEVMLDTMSRYGMGGEVTLSRQGQMVIQIGADGASPTQFRGRAAAAEFLARADEIDCPEDASIETIRADLALATACMVRDLQDSGQFEYVERDYIFQNQFARRPPESKSGTPGASRPPETKAGTPATPQPASFQPNDPLWALQWHFRDRGTSDGRAPAGAGFESFWQRQGNVGSSDVVVAVIDTGLQMSHPDIAGSPNIMPGWDMVSDPRMGNDGDGRDPDPTDPGDMCDPAKPGAADSFHGTHVAGTIGAAATNNGAGVAGGAWNVRIVPVRALGKCGGRLSDINDAIRWAAGLIPAEHPDGHEVWNEHPADIINLSIGLLGACPASLQDAISSATEQGVMVVAAAGNARMPVSFYAPAGCAGVVTVAAADARGHITPYSNYGAGVTLLAPGGDLSRDDNGDGKPDGVLSTKAASNCYDPVTGEGVENCYYAYEQGTSMAAPHVSAALALLKARNPGKSPDDLVSTMMTALDTRSSLQCASPCSQYPGTDPLPEDPQMCLRPCGSGLLNLSNIPVEPSQGGAR